MVKQDLGNKEDVYRPNKQEELNTMHSVFLFIVLTCAAMSILLFGGALFVYHFIMKAGSDASMAPMWIVLVTTIVSFLGLMMVYKKKKP